MARSDGSKLEKVIQFVSGKGLTYAQSISERKVFPSADALVHMKSLDRELQAEPLDPLVVLEEMERLGSPATVAGSGGRYFGFVVGGALPAALGANLMAGIWDQMAFSETSSPLASFVESVSRKWLLQLFGLPAETEVGFVTGATMANFTAMAAARTFLLENAGWNVVDDGLFGAPLITVITGDEVHASMLKALNLIGFGKNRIVRVPTDEQGRIRADQLPEISGPTIVCIQAGNVNTGSFDPAAEICQAAHARGAWVHVDGAFGLWAKVSGTHRHLTHGFERADSWSIDAHKWLNVPYDSGIVFVRNAKALKSAMVVQAAYLAPGQQRDPNEYVPEMSRRARGFEIWAALRSLGRKGIEEMIERNCRLAKRFAQKLSDAGYHILNDVVLNQVLVSFGAPEKTLTTVRRIQEEGTCWCGSTVWHGQTAMRISVSSWRTTEEDVDRSVEAMLRAATSIPES